MSAPPNTVETMPIADPIQSDEEIANIVALTKQLQDVEVRNVRIMKKREEWEAEAKKKKDEKDEADRLTREAKRKTEKVNKKKRVGHIETSFGLG